MILRRIFFTAVIRYLNYWIYLLQNCQTVTTGGVKKKKKEGKRKCRRNKQKESINKFEETLYESLYERKS